MENSKEITPKGEDEIRKEVVEYYGLDAEDETNTPFIEKAVKKELDIQNERIEAKKNLSKAIGQKIKKDEAISERDKKIAELLAKKEDDDEAELKPKGEPAPVLTDKTVENEELTTLKQKLSSLEERQQRRDYSHLTDEEYNAINSLAKADGKSFEDTMSNNPLAKNYLETNKVNQRIAGATSAPSTRISPASEMTYDKVDLSNPEHVNWLKSDPKRFEEYDVWMENVGSKNLVN